MSCLDDYPNTPLSSSSPGLVPGSSPLVSYMPINPLMVSVPLTPSATSSYSDDYLHHVRPSSYQFAQSPETWQTVSSDYSEFSPRPASHDLASSLHSHTEHEFSLGPAGWEAGRFYGYDLWKPDEDIVKNDDANAISRVYAWPHDLAEGPVDLLEEPLPANPGHDVKCILTSSSGQAFHAKTMPILIPWDLEPLPDK